MATTTMGPPAKRGSIASAIVWMFLLEILLFWIPVIGSLVAGFVGGQKAGSVGNAVMAVFLPIVIFSVVFGLMAGALLTVPLIGAFAGLGGFMFALTHVGPLLLGAIVGGLMVNTGRY